MHVLVGMPVLDVQYSLYTVPMPVNNRTSLYILTEVLAVRVCLYIQTMCSGFRVSCLDSRMINSHTARKHAITVLVHTGSHVSYSIYMSSEIT